jgi:hypothetical protein
MEDDRSILKILAGKSTGRISLGKSRRRWDDNIRIGLKVKVVNTKNWIN